MKKHRLEMDVNGEPVQADVPASRLLADFLREDLAMTGTKRGCETGVCGACSVLVDGEVVKSCLCLAVQMNGRYITTVEGLADRTELHPLQDCFLRRGGLQCGYCTPGFLMAAADLLMNNPNPTDEQIREGLGGNLCRCTGYNGIVDAIRDAAEIIHGH